MTRPVGRRSGAPDTRAEILDAARGEFAARGYDRATIRGIAAAAGVDPALVHHYFGSKDRLFTASIDLPFPPAELISTALAGGRGELGRRLATLFFSIWEQPEARISLLGILRSAMSGEEQAVRAFRQFVTRELQQRIAPALPGDEAPLRALLMASHLVGVAVTRYVVQLEPIASAPLDQLIDLIAPRVQSYVDGTESALL